MCGERNLFCGTVDPVICAWADLQLGAEFEFDLQTGRGGGGGGSEPAEQPDGRGGSLIAAGSADAVKKVAADEPPMTMMVKSVSGVE